MKGRELQSEVSIQNNEVYGTLYYQSEYGESVFPGHEDMKNGYFLVLSLTSSDEAATIKTMMTDAPLMQEEVEVDDGFCVYRITDKSKQKIKISAEGDSGEKNEVTLGLSHLVFD